MLSDMVMDWLSWRTSTSRKKTPPVDGPGCYSFFDSLGTLSNRNRFNVKEATPWTYPFALWLWWKVCFQEWKFNLNYRLTTKGIHSDLPEPKAYLKNTSLVIWGYISAPQTFLGFFSGKLGRGGLSLKILDIFGDQLIRPETIKIKEVLLN